MKVLSICGSPRKGNSETILLALKKIFTTKGVENEIILLRKKTINRCHGCVEYCNPQGLCCQQDDIPEIISHMCQADALIFISPNYFQMPTGLFKDFMDRSCIVFAAGKDKILKNKKAIVISVGTDSTEEIDVCANNIAKLYCRHICQVVATKSFCTHSELNKKYDDVFTSGLNPTIHDDLTFLAAALINN